MPDPQGIVIALRAVTLDTVKGRQRQSEPVGNGPPGGALRYPPTAAGHTFVWSTPGTSAPSRPRAAGPSGSGQDLARVVRPRLRQVREHVPVVDVERPRRGPERPQGPAAGSVRPRPAGLSESSAGGTRGRTGRAIARRAPLPGGAAPAAPNQSRPNPRGRWASAVQPAGPVPSPTVPVGRELRRQRLADLTRRPVEPRREPASDGPPPRRPALRGPGRGAGVAPEDQPVALLGALTSRPPMGRALNLEPPRRHGEDPARTEPCVVVHGLDIGTVQESLHTSPRAGRTRSGPVCCGPGDPESPYRASQGPSRGAGRGEDGGGSGRFRSEAPSA